jgi:protein phosphatase
MGDLHESAGGAVYASALQGARNEQQDSVRVRWLAGEHAWLIVVADGMGGHAAGSLASRLAVDCFVSAFAALRQGAAGLRDAFLGALRDANDMIGSVQASRPETAGMGTTLVAAHISAEGVRWVSVGDSPLWLYRDGAIARLNEDHSLRQVAAAAPGGASNKLTSALVGKDIRTIDVCVEPVALRKGDLVIAASDGVLTLPDEEVARVVADNASRRVDAIAERLIEAVAGVEQPRQDNCTIVVSSRVCASRRRLHPAAWLGYALLAAAVCAGAALAVLHSYP